MKHLKQLGDRFEITLPKDEEGYVGRECPECKAFFKVMPGTGTANQPAFHCPYCGHEGHISHFHTKDQIEYAKSVVANKVMGALFKDRGTWPPASTVGRLVGFYV